MKNYDFFIAGRWRNKDKIAEITEIVRASGKNVYCFIENKWDGEEVEFDFGKNPEDFMADFESLEQTHPLVKKVFEYDMNAQRNSDNFLLVLPAGIAGHVEAGAAYGMGKKCYAFGKLEKTETLYCIFEEIFPDEQALKAWLDKN